VRVSTLTQYDPARIKKNLDANKKKLADKTAANESLQKSLSKTKNENAELQAKIQELESKLAELDTSDATEEEAAA
jgi:chromosome segregation ATPase